MDELYALIKQRYENSRNDSTELFRTILSVAEESGLERALGCLETCVTEKRLAWLNLNLERSCRTDDPVADGYRLFYERYLGVSIPGDGEIVERTDRRMVMRWRNRCPTLEACQQFGLDTRVVCKKAYHGPVQAFLSRVDPRLRFDRDYEALRPYRSYCEEIITLEE
jgi:hypothetical protein